MARQTKMVVEELLTKPSAVSPMLFVGLGGCGCRMAARVARRLRQRPDYAERYRELVKFALLDTNVNDLESYRELADETFLISDFEKEQYANLASGKLFLEEDTFFTQWVPRDYRFRAGDTAGAGQIRIESRLALYYQMKHKDLVPRFRRLLEDLKSHELGHRRLDSPEIRIVICYSVAGGTGSGSHLPLAYMLRDQARELGKPRLIGVAVLPAVFEDQTGINKDGTFANGYAALMETEYLMKLGAPDSRFYPDGGLPFHYNPAEESKRRVREQPFEFVYVVDKPESFSVSEPVDAAADGLYLQFFSPLYGRQASDYDNYTQHQRFLVPHDFEAKGIIGFTSFYGSYGAAVLLVPAPGLVEYSSQAAALSLMRENFLRDIPGEPLYDSLRLNREGFDEATLNDGKDERGVPRSEFTRKEPLVRERLWNRLFLKRVQLLAACEQRHGVAGRFMALFRHGHRPGEFPKASGGFDFRPDLVKADREQLADGRMRFSINAVVFQAVLGEAGRRGASEAPRGLPGLLAQARKVIEAGAAEDTYSVKKDVTAGQVKAVAVGWADEYRKIGLRVLRDGYKSGTLNIPGLESLVELRFLTDEAGQVDLSAKRYAVLRILEEVDWDLKPDERDGSPAGLPADADRIAASAVPALVEKLRDRAVEDAMVDVKRAFIERLGDFKTSLTRFADVQRVLEGGFEELEREQTRRLERLRTEGDSSANDYVLDAEALCTEDGRRLWDFFYEDRLAGLPELSLANRDIQVVLSDMVRDLSVSGVGATGAVLERLFHALRQKAREYIAPRVEGQLRSPDPATHDGLTLPQALALEVEYRALYLSDAARVNREGHAAIRDIVARYRALPPGQQIDLHAPQHRDYLHDKLKRTVKEKASLLCVYDESRDQHGGVRPDHIFLAAIDERFKDSPIAEILRGADIPHLEWVSTGWHDPKAIIFYRAVLNVPLYVFGRLLEMRDHYYRFRNLAKRSKVLHIDRNWEGTLADLDPDAAQEKHRQEQVRAQVINFATLLTTTHPERDETGYIVRRGGRYFLVDPVRDNHDSAFRLDDGLAHLGDSLTLAIRRLPEVLEAEKVKYLPYQFMLKGVRDGVAPNVLSAVARLPFVWRRNRDQLRTQYGSAPEPEQIAKLRDYEDAFNRLRESLDALLDRLRNSEIELHTQGEDATTSIGALRREQVEHNLRQSILILTAFSETWKRMESPDQGGDISTAFRPLFNPLDEDALNRSLEDLRLALTGGSAQPSA